MNSRVLITPATEPHLCFPITNIPKTPSRVASFNPQLHQTPIRVRSLRSTAAANDRYGYTTAKEELSFYELLGIPETGSLPEIKQAYRQLARKYHPDVSPPGRVEEYTKRFLRVQQAYETLSDPNRRALYDRDMAKGIHWAFSAKKWCQSDEELEDKGKWKSRWEQQLSELKRRSMNRAARGNMSWGARMRKQRDESPGE